MSSETVRAAGRKAWRQYVTDGVPSSGANSPRKSEISDFVNDVADEFNTLGTRVTDVEAELESFEVTADSVTKALWSELLAVTGARDGQRGVVMGPDATDYDSGGAGTHTDPVTSGTVANVGTYTWVDAESGWQWLTETIEENFTDLASVAQTIDEGSFRVLDDEGFEVIKTHKDFGVSLGGAWFDSLVTKLLQVRDLEHFSLFGLSREKGLELPYCYLRPSTGGLLRVMDLEGFIYFQVDGDGLTRFVDGGSSGSGGAGGTVNWVMSGRVSPTGVDIMADIDGLQSSQATLIIATDEYMTNVVYSSAATMPMVTASSGTSKYRNARWRVTGLTANTQYYFKVAVDGVLQDGDAATFKTFPVFGTAAGFKFWVGSCSRWTISENIESINYINENPDGALFLAHLGDITYADIDADDIFRFRAELIRAMMNYPIGKQLGRTLPLVLTHDDHDAPGPNDAMWESEMGDGSERPDAVKTWRGVYRETALPYALAQQADGETDPDKLLLAQEWDVGTARFLMTDCMSQRTQEGDTPSMLGTGTNPPDSWNQLQWLKDRLLASNDDGIELIFLLVSPTWFTGGVPGSWGYQFTAERTEICDFLRDNDIPSVVLICGDGHRPIIDDGIASDYATGGGAGFAAIQASAFRSGANIGIGGSSRWLGGTSLSGTSVQNATKLEVHESGGEITGWTCTHYIEPITDGVPTVLGPFSTTDAEREIQFTETASNVGASTTAEIEVERTFLGIGASSATWTSSNGGQTGTVTFNANQRLATITVNTPASGSFTVTLSAPTGKNTVLGTDDEITLTVV